MLLWLASNWKLVVVGALIFALGAYGQTMRIERDVARNEYSDFRREVALAAQKAAEAALQKTIADEKKKEEADAAHAKDVADLTDRIKRLRDSRPSSNLLSATPACPPSPEGADRYRTEYQRAYRDLVDGLRAEGDRGSKAVADLNGAKRWAVP